MYFANVECKVDITLGTLTEGPVTSADMTDDEFVFALTAGIGLSGGTFEKSQTIEHEGGAYHYISYLYAVDAGTSLENTIEQVFQA